MKVVAFHGDGSRPEDLRSDMGAPAWVDEYAAYGRDAPDNYLERLQNQDDLMLVGYSRYGS